jgi:hypothetical protein
MAFRYAGATSNFSRAAAAFDESAKDPDARPIHASRPLDVGKPPGMHIRRSA